MSFHYDLRIAGMRMRILAPREITWPEQFSPFLVPPAGEPDLNIHVFFGTSDVTAAEGCRLRRTMWKKGTEEIIRIEPAGKNQPYRLGLPLGMEESVYKYGNWLLLLDLKRLLLPFGRVILHASAVIHEGQAYVFTAPSGTGKSTQADIWHREYGAEVINGDKVVLCVEEGRCIAYGSPVAGSSGIYKNISAPVAAIIQLRQGNRNSISQADLRSGYFALYSGLVKSNRDQAFNQKLLPHVEEILQTVPVLTLSCRPERAAADCVLEWMQSNAQIEKKK